MPQLPPFCPNMVCENHTRPAGENWYRPFGWYMTKAHGRVKRYACRRCGKSFSEQTFRLSYYLHINIPLQRLLRRLSACSGIRALARSYRVTDKVITNRIGRLGRQAIGVMAGVRCSQDCDEALVVDGFESLIRSPYGSNYIHLLIGQTSQYIHACDFAFLRRDFAFLRRDFAYIKRKRLAQAEKSVSGEVYASFERICHTLDDLSGDRRSIVLRTNKEKEYRAVLEENGYLDGKVTHLPTLSREAGTRSNQSRAANDDDRELRKSRASRFRRTTRWSQEANNCMEWMYVYAGFHNFFKPFRIKQRNGRTHAEIAGFNSKRLRVLLKTFFTNRFFYSKVSFSISEWLVWLRAYQSPFRSGYQNLPGYVTGKERLIAWPQAA